jgi:hypothetical protein
MIDLASTSRRRNRRSLQTLHFGNPPAALVMRMRFYHKRGIGKTERRHGECWLHFARVHFFRIA